MDTFVVNLCMQTAYSCMLIAYSRLTRIDFPNQENWQFQENRVFHQYLQ